MAILVPKISIVIPCFNEAKFIDRCLDSVFAFEPVPNGFEVLVIDGMSEDGTRKILAEWSKRKPNLYVFDNPLHTVPVGMNIGIKKAKGELILRLDAHSEYPPDYLRLCVETIHHTGADNVGGLFITLPRGESLGAKLVQAITTSRFGVGNADFRLGGSDGPADTVPYGCYRKKVFERIGWYDERLRRNQDYELNSRLTHSGGRIWLNPAIKVYYYNQGTLRGLLKQAIFTGKWNPWMWYVAPYSFKLRHCIPGLFVLALLIAFGFSFFSFGGKILVGFILFPYFALAILAAIQQANRYGWWMALVLPFLFFSYHFSYGIGILWGTLLLLTGKTPVQKKREPWQGAGRFRAGLGA
jgi:glycosyltransferase involved in cell wall biosynthesis